MIIRKYLKGFLVYIVVLGIFSMCINPSIVLAYEEDLDCDYNMLYDYCTKANYGDVVIISRDVLYDMNENEIAYVYFLSSNGYIITNLDGIVLESSNVINPFTGNNHIYYFGYGEYYINFENKYYNLLTGICEDESTLVSMDTIVSDIVNTVETNTVNLQLASESTSHYLPYSPSCFTSEGSSVADLGVCGYVASAIYLDYYNRYIYNYNMIPSQYQNSAALIDRLYSFGSGGTGLSQNEMVSVINSFMQSNNKSGYLYMTAISNADYTKYCNIINQDKPVIVAIINHPTYAHHAIVGYAYFDVVSNGVRNHYITVNNGWGSNGVTINWNYVENITYSVD